MTEFDFYRLIRGAIGTEFLTHNRPQILEALKQLITELTGSVEKVEGGDRAHDRY